MARRATHPISAVSIGGGPLLSISADVRSTDDVIAFEGKDHLDTAGILFSMGNVLAMRQKIAEARGKFSRALEIYQGRGMGQHPQAKMVEAAMKSLQNK